MPPNQKYMRLGFFGGGQARFDDFFLVECETANDADLKKFKTADKTVIDPAVAKTALEEIGRRRR